MSRIKIKNFGPVKAGYGDKDGWLDIRKVTVFTGNQGSGKSTVAKLISTFTWIEKALVRGDYDKIWFEEEGRFKHSLLSYHRLESYLHPESVIEYEGDAYAIKYQDNVMSICVLSYQTYPLPQIMYVPAERNFLAYVKTPNELKVSSESLKEFLTEYDNAKHDIKGVVHLPINQASVEYDKLNDILNLKGEDYKVRLTDASSGFQSFVPLFLVSDYLANSASKQKENRMYVSGKEMMRFKKGVQDIWDNESLTDEQKRIALSVLSSKFNKTAFVNIVEEPEQNLYPSSQWKMLQSLLELNNMSDGNKLIMTTHSPYLINYLTLAVKAGILKPEIKTDEQRSELARIVPLPSAICPEDLAIYELDERNGAIQALKTYDDLPSDENKLNEELDEGNELFAQLLELQQKLSL
ncbi:MAG: ATP-binding protein [Tannerellaceae bacterium]|jgi:predicted ATPase|nr:ATP-binding protein [Tannerellaceae bacterium]